MTFDLYKLARPLLMAMPAETAHQAALFALRCGMAGRVPDVPPLPVTLWRRTFANPLGLAAGFDKDAVALAPLARQGFGFLEAGTVTLHPQAGNPRPRIFRDVQSKAVLNRMGFPGGGVEKFIANMKAQRGRNPDMIAGVNIGVNKDSIAPQQDYAEILSRVLPVADYITVNISSPNTPGLRDLQCARALNDLLTALTPLRGDKPLLVKLSPDMAQEELVDVVALARQHDLSGLILTNTTITRGANMPTVWQSEKGGVSGAPLRGLSTAVLRRTYQLSSGELPLIGVGGIMDAADAYEKIRAGASLLQVYSGLVFKGPRLIPDILKGLENLLERDGFSSVASAVGADCQ